MPLFSPRFKNSLDVGGGREIGFDDDEIVNFLNPNGKDDYVSADIALRNSDIYSTVFQLSADLASSRLITDNSRNQSMLNNPTTWTNSFSFWQAVYAQLLLGGEAFVYRWRNNNGIDVRWEYLRPSQVSVFPLEDYSGLYYDVNFDAPLIGVKQSIPSNDMIHFRLLSQNGGATGISPLRSLASELKIKDSSNKLTINALAKSVLTPGILSVKGQGLLSAKLKSSRSRQFMNQINNSNGGPVVTDSLEEYTPLEIKGDVSKLLSQTDWTSKQIAKAYGIPDSVLNGKGDQQSSLKMIGGDYAKALMRFSRSITSELSNKQSSLVNMDVKPAIDPVNDDYTTNINAFKQSDMLTAGEAKWLLKQTGYLPQDMPDIPETNIERKQEIDQEN
ncbi:phage portal protein [Leuconostoc carnosum]|uniref:phage portal protein n=1 Tax=Leuconostoc carnosum TaxID=1252 RepID=UPI000D51726B|nr:phage portal protein [Leuconostoc carnosum]WLC58825.1 phage portal protein [Leuconostoc carnosum]WLC97594.1 phage portal protein [Leuconostoc carnosum]WLC98171.1 phage portal protein [Leuconostoc carnosum]SPJ44095.1 Phage portal protein [Leuconostoc carnosum]